jgi:hypothetical protein
MKTDEVYTLQKHWKPNENWWKTLQKQLKPMKADEKHYKNNKKNNEIWWKTLQKQWPPMKIDEKHCKNNEK